MNFLDYYNCIIVETAISDAYNNPNYDVIYDLFNKSFKNIVVSSAKVTTENKKDNGLLEYEGLAQIQISLDLTKLTPENKLKFNELYENKEMIAVIPAACTELMEDKTNKYIEDLIQSVIPEKDSITDPEFKHIYNYDKKDDSMIINLDYTYYGERAI